MRAFFTFNVVKLSRSEKGMELLGIDFGTSRLRVATESGGSIGVKPHRLSSQRLPFVIESTKPFRITALKRMLDFEAAFPVPPSGMSSTALLAQIFKQVFADCCSNGLSESRAVVTVPPCFSQRQRSALRSVMTECGLTRVKLMDDTLAALWASWDRVKQFQRILVYAWGAGTFSAAAYSLRSNVYQLVSQEGDRQLGGDDFDAVMSDALVAALRNLGGDTVPRSAQDFLRVVSVAEELKRSLAPEGAVSVPLNRLLESQPSDAACLSVAAAPLRDAIERSTQATITLALRAASSSSESKPEAILAVGGTALSPLVQAALRRTFEIPIIQASEESVAIGSVQLGLRLPESEWAATDRQNTLVQQAAPLSSQAQVATQSPVPEVVPGADQTPRNRWSQNFVDLLNTAQTEYEAGRLAGSIGALEQVADAINTFKSDLYCKAAAALNAEGKTSRALELLRDGSLRNPRNSYIAVDFAQMCYREATQARGRKKPQIAVQLAEEGITALRVLPKGESQTAVLLAGLLHMQGVGLCDQGKLAPAIPVLTEGAHLDPKNPAYAKDLDTVRQMLKRLGPNDKCPCGSGAKYKKCCGKVR